MALRASQGQWGHWGIDSHVQVSMELGTEDLSLLERCPHFRGWCPRKGRAPRRGAWRRSRPLSPEWPAAAPVLAVSETCAWVSEVEARR